MSQSQFYSSNAEAVSDFLQNYSDNQIEGIGEMTDSLANQKDLQWKEDAEKPRTEGDLSGEVLGGILGLKGVKAGYGKLKDIYGKMKALKAKGEDLKKKVSGKDDDDDDDTKVDDEALDEDDVYHTAPFQTGDETETGANTEENVESTDPGKVDDVDTTEGGEGSSDPVSLEDLENMSSEDLAKFVSSAQEETEDAGESFVEPKLPPGGEQELDVFSSDVPSEFTETRTLTTSLPEEATEGFTGLQDFSQARSLGGTFTQTRTFDLDTPETVDRPDFSSEDVQQPATTTATDTATTASSTATDTATTASSTAEDLATTASSTAEDLASTASKATSYLGSTADNLVSTAGKAVSKAATDLASTVTSTATDLAASTLGEVGATALSAVPVIGEVGAIGFGLYEGIKGLVDLFEGSDKPDVKEVSAANLSIPQLNSTQLTSKLASSIPTATNDVSFDSAGIASF